MDLNSKGLALHAIVLLLVLMAVESIQGQPFGGRGRRALPDRSTFPMWENPKGYEEDVFTFARLKYTPHYRRGWNGDYPEADWNISYRLQELTSMKVNPHPVALEITDPDLFQHPFAFLIAPRSVIFTDAEAEALRRYLLTGGFLMVDEFWGPEQWDHFYWEMKRVFPNKEPVELPLEHEIFNNVYRLKEKPQVVAIHIWQRGLSYHPLPGVAEDPEPRFYGIFDDKGRMMVLLCHNNDLVDGWEREGEDEAFFREYSEKSSYPMGINIIFYAMTH